MKTKEYWESQIEILKDKLHRMLEENNGKINEEIVEVSQALDELIIEEVKIYNYKNEK